jgi:hypothetical protein
VLFVHTDESLWRQGWQCIEELVEVWLTAAEKAAHYGLPA